MKNRSQYKIIRFGVWPNDIDRPYADLLGGAGSQSRLSLGYYGGSRVNLHVLLLVYDIVLQEVI